MKTVKFGKRIWCVLKHYDNDNGYLLLARDAVTYRPYHSVRKLIRWDECDLRKWLNNEFIKEFSPEEQEKIIPSTILSVDIYKFEKPMDLTKWQLECETYHLQNNRAYYRIKTVDKIFLLSAEDIDLRMKQNTERNCFIKLNSSNEPIRRSEPCIWWLRPYPGETSSSVLPGETEYTDFQPANTEKIAVRPAMFVNLSPEDLEKPEYPYVAGPCPTGTKRKANHVHKHMSYMQKIKKIPEVQRYLWDEISDCEYEAREYANSGVRNNPDKCWEYLKWRDKYREIEKYFIYAREKRIRIDIAKVKFRELKSGSTIFQLLEKYGYN